MDSREGSQGAGVIVVGAGPVGLSAALALVKQGVAVTLLEKGEHLSAASKASTFHPPTLEILHEFGVIASMLSAGCKADRIQYRWSEEGAFAEFDLALLAGDTPYPFRIHLEQAQVTPLLLERLRASGLCTIAFGQEVVDAGSGEEWAWVRTRGTDGAESTFEGACVLAADGARSAVRGAVGIAYEGERYPGRVLRLMTSLDLTELLPGVAPVTYLYRRSGETISLLRMADCWRIIVRVPEGESEERVQEPDWYLPVVRRHLPIGDGALPLVGKDVYGASKMVAERYHAGRIFLIGDSAHLTNTRGGMNMNCGIHDAYAMAAAIAEALGSGSFDGVEEVSDQRRRVAVDSLIPRTDRNVAGGLGWLETITETAADPAKAHAYLRTTAMLDIAPRPGLAADGMRAEA